MSRVRWETDAELLRAAGWPMTRPAWFQRIVRRLAKADAAGHRITLNEVGGVSFWVLHDDGTQECLGAIDARRDMSHYAAAWEIACHAHVYVAGLGPALHRAGKVAA